MSAFRMPSLGADMDDGTLVEWMKQPGDHVRRGDAIAAVETQKGAIEIESFETGVLDDIRVQVGEKVPVGTVLAMIRTDGEAESTAPSAPPTPPSPPAGEPARTSVPSVPAPASAAGSIGNVRITPAARQRARERGIDMATVARGPDGVIGLREVDAAASSAGPSRAPAAAKPGLDLAEMRKAIAAAMARSWREIPHYFVRSVLDMEPMLAWLEQRNADRPVAGRLHYAVPLIKATALALKAVPVLNGQRDDDGGFRPADAVHLGIAIALRGGGLVAPAILDAERLDLDTLMQRLDDLVRRVRTGRLRSSEMTAATATFSNLGEHTADALQPVIYPPQVAIVGCGCIAERPWAEANALSVRRTLEVTVGGDHRVSDGRSAARLLNDLARRLSHPEQL